MEVAARIAKPSGIIGVSEDILKPEYAAAIGLMLGDNERSNIDGFEGTKKAPKKQKKQKEGNFFSRIFKLFK